MRALILTIILALASDVPPMRCVSDTQCMQMFGGYGDPTPRITKE
jgi:hypothetical protein